MCDAAKDGVTVQYVGENEDGEYNEFYIHGKAILADYGESSAKVFIGSQNFSSTSLTENREPGLIINDTSIESSLNSTFQSDFAGGTPWS